MATSAAKSGRGPTRNGLTKLLFPRRLQPWPLYKYRNKRGGTVLLLCIALQSSSVAVFSQESAVPPELIRYADIVLYNGQVLTADADENFTIARANWRRNDFTSSHRPFMTVPTLNFTSALLSSASTLQARQSPMRTAMLIITRN